MSKLSFVLLCLVFFSPSSLFYSLTHWRFKNPLSLSPTKTKSEAAWELVLAAPSTVCPGKQWHRPGSLHICQTVVSCHWCTWKIALAKQQSSEYWIKMLRGRTWLIFKGKFPVYPLPACHVHNPTVKEIRENQLLSNNYLSKTTYLQSHYLLWGTYSLGNFKVKDICQIKKKKFSLDNTN